MRSPARIVCWTGLLVALAAPPAPADPITDLRSALPAAAAPELFSRGRKTSQSEDLAKAMDSFRKRDYDRALTHFQEARKKDPNFPPARLALARAFLATSQVPAARGALEQAAVEAPDYPGVYAAFGQLALVEGRRTDALLHFEKAGALARTGRLTDELKHYFQGQAHAGIATVAEARKDWEGARTALAAQLELEPKNGAARQNLARVLFAQGKAEPAHAELRQAVKDDPALPPAAVSMGWLWARQKDAKKAAEWMAAAVKEEPKNARAHAGLAEWLLEQERAAEARAAAEAAAQLDPDLAELKALRGFIAWQLREPAEAERYFAAVHQESPGDFAASNQLALALAEQKDDAKRQRAVQLAEMNARLYPGSGDALGTLAWVYDRVGRASDAEQVARAARSRGTGSSDTAYYLARILSDPSRPDEVKPLLKTALEAPGRFTYRKEAREWLDRLSAKP
jgi:tetratricopeptide (TPR) repeat protein